MDPTIVSCAFSTNELVTPAVRSFVLLRRFRITAKASVSSPPFVATVLLMLRESLQRKKFDLMSRALFQSEIGSDLADHRRKFKTVPGKSSA